MDNNRSIVWNYIDTEKAAIKAMEDYQNMKKLELILSADTRRSNDYNFFRMQQTKEYLDWFEPAWYSLDEEDRLILKENTRIFAFGCSVITNILFAF